jgi:hypothetical protein
MTVATLLEFVEFQTLLANAVRRRRPRKVLPEDWEPTRKKTKKVLVNTVAAVPAYSTNGWQSSRVTLDRLHERVLLRDDADKAQKRMLPKRRRGCDCYYYYLQQQK